MWGWSKAVLRLWSYAELLRVLHKQHCASSPSSLSPRRFSKYGTGSISSSRETLGSPHKPVNTGETNSILSGEVLKRTRVPFSGHTLNLPLYNLLWTPRKRAGTDVLGHCVCSARAFCPTLAVLRGRSSDSEVWTWLVASPHTAHRHTTLFPHYY